MEAGRWPCVQLHSPSCSMSLGYETAAWPLVLGAFEMEGSGRSRQIIHWEISSICPELSGNLLSFFFSGPPAGVWPIAVSCPPGHDVKSNLSHGSGEPFSDPPGRSLLKNGQKALLHCGFYRHRDAWCRPVVRGCNTLSFRIPRIVPTQQTTAHPVHQVQSSPTCPTRETCGTLPQCVLLPLDSGKAGPVLISVEFSAGSRTELTKGRFSTYAFKMNFTILFSGFSYDWIVWSNVPLHFYSDEIIECPHSSQ